MKRQRAAQSVLSDLQSYGLDVYASKDGLELDPHGKEIQVPIDVLRRLHRFKSAVYEIVKQKKGDEKLESLREKLARVSEYDAEFLASCNISWR